MEKYLPIIDDTTPGFIDTLTLKVKYPVALSVVGAIIRIVNPMTGEYSLPEKLIFQAVSNPTSIMTTDNSFTFSIDNNNLKKPGDSFQVSVKLTTQEPNTDIESWLANIENLNATTPWSVSVLFNAVNEPSLTIEPTILNDGENTASIDGYFVSGEGSFDNLKWFQIIRNNAISDRIYPKRKNIISYQLQDVIAEETYFIKGETEKGYLFTSDSYEISESALTSTVVYENVVINEVGEGQATDVLTVVNNEELGALDVMFTLESDATRQITLIIERASITSNFEKWEKIKDLSLLVNNTKSNNTYVIQDLFLQPGVPYQYRVYATWAAAQADGSARQYTTPKITTKKDEYYVSTPEDIFLTSKDLQLRVKYNPDISSFKYNVKESIIPTLGGKYPIVRRVGDQQYASFNIGGLISYNAEIYENDQELVRAIVDKDSKHGTSPQELYKESVFNQFNNSLFFNVSASSFDYVPKYYQHLASEVRTAILEKIFRDKVIEFLYSDSVKLFKSLQEGSKIIKLSNISLTPNKTLGRNIYSFTAQATEVAEYSLENCKKYFDPVEEEQYSYVDYVLLASQNSEAIGNYYISVNEIFNINDQDYYNNSAVIHEATIPATESQVSLNDEI